VDFEKAFDKVSVPKLLHKLRGVGISGLLLQCIDSFLTSRTQSVRIDAVQSSPLAVISGVPQGSVLGPFLFLLFINDLPEALDDSFTSKLFADDLKAYDVFCGAEGNDKFQHSLNCLVDWSSKWQLNLSVSKCGSLLIAGKSTFKDESELVIKESKISALNYVKDLGVLIDSKLSFEEHIGSIISKSNQRTYLLFKAFTNRNVNLMVFAFKTYILPLLDYCSTIWCPFRLCDIDRIERLQRSFTKRLDGLRFLTYKERLVACNLTSLELRRLRIDLILCFKIVHNLIALDFNHFFEFQKSVFNTRGHKYKLRIPRVQKSLRKNFFSVRVIPAWNFLPDAIVCAVSINIFKCELMKINLS
jgi:ribonuclease P/MRP protein subunit RPP40